MSTIPEIKQRLAGEGTPFLLVAGAAQFASVKDRPTALPAAYVFISREASAENQRATGKVLQRSERDVSVVIVLEDLSDARGDAAADELEEAKSFVRGQLIGFLPTDMAQAGDPITHVSGEVLETRAGCVWFEDVYSAPTYLKELPDA